MKKEKQDTVIGLKEKEAKIKKTINEKDLYEKSILQSILESSIEYSIVATDLEGKILIWNEGARSNYGYEQSEVINKKNIVSLHTLEDVKSGLAQEFMKKALVNGKAEGVFERVRKDGSRFTASVMLAIRQDDKGKPVGFVMISKNITEANQIEKALLKSNKELAEFVYLASHDLKAPLRAIQRLAYWIEEDNADKLDDQSKNNLLLLCKRTSRMASLIDGILQYSRAGHDDSDIELVNLKELIKEIVENVNSDKRFKISYPEHFPVFETPRAPLIQVLSNLISNSIKHHDKEKGTIKIDIKDSGEFYIFTVSDDGPGIEPQYFDKIFMIFQTLKSRDELEATGIGLSIVKKIIESYGGKIKVKSKLGEGTTMIFTWPKYFGKKSKSK